MIRRALPEDVAAIRAVYAPYVESSPASFELEVPGEEEMRRRMAESICWFVSDEGGYAYASRHRERPAYRWSVDTSVYVAPERRGRGIGSALYDRLLSSLRDLGYVNAYAGITLPNAASVALHESFGYAPVGIYRHVGYKFGRWHDVGWWSLRLVEPPAEPVPPRRFHG
jgi:phosphinothricin acetyltransferase